MEYKKMLLIVATATALGLEEFDSRSISKLTGLPTKIVSNELRRLYFMGFLKRKRVKRIVKTRSGKTCFRGYEYKYSISSQGWKYIRYLANPDREDEDVKGIKDLIVLKIIEENAPKDQRKLWRDIWKAYFSGRKGFKRFSTTRNRIWDKLVEAKLKLDEWRDKVKELEETVKSLREKVEALERENEALRRENAELRRKLLEKSTTQFNPAIKLKLLKLKDLISSYIMH